MPAIYIKHWFLFVFSLSILLKISDIDYQQAKKALYLFVKDVEVLYGSEFMKYNVHLLLHLPDFVKRYGALWAWSAFPPERYDGVLKKLFHGTQCVPQQLAKTRKI